MTAHHAAVAHRPCGRARFCFTVSANAANEDADQVCPVWPGQSLSAHWGIPDPAAVEGSDMEKWEAFRDAFRALENRIKLFLSLPLASPDNVKLKERVNAIGRTSEVG